MVKLFSFFQFVGIIILLLVSGFSMKKIGQVHELLGKRNLSLAKENEELKILLKEANSKQIALSNQLAEASAKNHSLAQQLTQQEQPALIRTQNPGSCGVVSREKEELQKKYNYLLVRLSQAVKAKQIAPL